MNKFFQIVTNNFFVKLICFIAALVLWLNVAISQTSVVKFPGSIKIKPANVGTDFVAIYDTKSVEIKVLSKSTAWQKLSTDSFSATVNLAGLSEGTHEVNVNVVPLVPDISVVESSPKKLIVRLEKVITKELPITARIEGSAAEGLVPGDITFSPEKVIVRGAKSSIESLTEVSLPIVLAGESADFKKNGSVLCYDDKGEEIQNLEVIPEKVSANIAIVKGSTVKTVGIKPHFTGSIKPGYYIASIVITPNSVEINGTRTAVNETKYIETASVDIGDLSSALERDVGLVMPSGVTLASPLAKVHVQVTVLPGESSMQYSITSYQPENLRNLSVVSYSPTAVIVTLSGPIEVLNRIKPFALSLRLDFNDKFPNENSEMEFVLKPEMLYIPEGVKFVSFSVNSIWVKIR
ncbi:MAG TPA: CdaR family protein [bacterium]|nr:CdaR family protein [bacterium]